MLWLQANPEALGGGSLLEGVVLAPVLVGLGLAMAVAPGALDGVAGQALGEHPVQNPGFAGADLVQVPEAARAVWGADALAELHGFVHQEVLEDWDDDDDDDEILLLSIMFMLDNKNMQSI